MPDKSAWDRATAYCLLDCLISPNKQVRPGRQSPRGLRWRTAAARCAGPATCTNGQTVGRSRPAEPQLAFQVGVDNTVTLVGCELGGYETGIRPEVDSHWTSALTLEIRNKLPPTESLVISPVRSRTQQLTTVNSVFEPACLQ